MTLNIRFLMTAAALALLPVPVQAQSATPATPPLRSVAERLRPEFAPIGGRLGAFFLYPTLSLTGAATDNARASDLDKRGDVFLVALADAKLVSKWSVHALNTHVYASQSVHTLKTENAAQYGAQIDGRYDIRRDGNIGLLFRADHLVEDRSSFNTVNGAREPIRYNRARAAVSTEQGFGRLALRSTLSYTRFRYEDAETLAGVPLPQQFRNVNIAAAAGSVAYAVSPGYSLLVSGTIDRRDYTLASADPRQPGNLNRDSNGGRIEAGVRLALTDLISGEIRAGYLKRNYADPRLRDTGGTSFGANVLWNVTQLTSLQVFADRRIDEAASVDVAGNRVTELTATLDHELRRNLIISGLARYAVISPLGNVGASKERGGRLTARYLMNRQFSLRAGYTRGERSSPDPALRLHENRVTGGVDLTF